MPATAQSFRAPLSDLVLVTLCTRAHLPVAGLPFDRQSCVSEILGKFTSFLSLYFRLDESCLNYQLEAVAELRL